MGSSMSSSVGGSGTQVLVRNSQNAERLAVFLHFCIFILIRNRVSNIIRVLYITPHPQKIHLRERVGHENRIIPSFPFLEVTQKKRKKIGKNMKMKKELNKIRVESYLPTPNTSFSFHFSFVSYISFFFIYFVIFFCFYFHIYWGFFQRQKLTLILVSPPAAAGENEAYT